MSPEGHAIEVPDIESVVLWDVFHAYFLAYIRPGFDIDCSGFLLTEETGRRAKRY